MKQSDDDELRLVHDLFENYSKEVRPVKNKETPIQVKFGIAYTQLVELVRGKMSSDKNHPTPSPYPLIMTENIEKNRP